MIEFLNIFVIPLISISVLEKRGRVKASFDFRFVMQYALTTVLVFLATFFVFKITEVLAGISAEPSSQFYTVVAVILAWLMPYLYEIIRKYIEVRVEIRKKKD